MLMPITNEPRDYAWGSESLMADYLSRVPSGRPEAELWFGAHPASPSVVIAGDRAGARLNAAIDALGASQPKILLKLLAANEPLSLQCHPNAAQARVGYEREEAAGIPRDAPHRNYRDPYAKPELLVAVTNFEALSGFRPREEAIAVFEALATVDPRLAPVAARVGESDVLEWLLSEPGPVTLAVEAVSSAAAGIADRHPLDADTVERLAATHPDDPGILIALLLNRVTLEPGQAIFLPAGNIHAYLGGLGVELMTASDNVLRCALTPKHVDVAELLAVIDHAPLADPLLPSERMAGATAYRPAAPFELRRVDGEHRVSAGRALLIAVAGTRVEFAGEVREVRAGEGVWVQTDDPFSISSDEAWLALERDGSNEP